MEGYNFLYDKLIDLADYERFKSGVAYSTDTPLTDLQYSFNTTTKLAKLNKTSTTVRSGFKVPYTGLLMGDVVEVTLEVYNEGAARFKAEMHETGYLRTVFASSKSDDWETIKFKYTKRWNSHAELFFGFLEADTGVSSVRNISVKVHTKTKPLHVVENIKRYLICKQPQAQFELRADFANDPGTFSLTDDFTMRIWFGTQFVNKRPVVIISEGGYNESIKYRPRAFDVQKNFVTIKLFDKNDAPVNITTLPTGEYIFINVLVIDESTLL